MLYVTVFGIPPDDDNVMVYGGIRDNVIPQAVVRATGNVLKAEEVRAFIPAEHGYPKHETVLIRISNPRVDLGNKPSLPWDLAEAIGSAVYEEFAEWRAYMPKRVYAVVDTGDSANPVEWRSDVPYN